MKNGCDSKVGQTVKGRGPSRPGSEGGEHPSDPFLFFFFRRLATTEGARGTRRRANNSQLLVAISNRGETVFAIIITFAEERPAYQQWKWKLP